MLFTSGKVDVGGVSRPVVWGGPLIGDLEAE